QGAASEGTGGLDALGAAGADALAGDRSVKRRAVPDPRQGRRGQGDGPIADIAAPVDDEPEGVRDGVGRPPYLDDAPCRARRSRSPLRRHLVPRRDTQIPPAVGRGAGRLVLLAALRAGFAAV